MRRFDQFLRTSLPRYLDMDCVERVVVTDETGEDAAAIRAQPWGTHPKLSVHVNHKQLGALGNKHACVLVAHGRARTHAHKPHPVEWLPPPPSDGAPEGCWVALLDSDNFADEADFFAPWQAWLAANTYPGVEAVVCAPGHARVRDDTAGVSVAARDADFTAYTQLDLTNVGQAMTESARAFQLMNNGNFIVHSTRYTRAITHPLLCKMADEERFTSYDAALKLVQLLVDGCVLRVIPQMCYDHAVHAGSLVLQRQQSDQRREHALWNALFKLCRSLQSEYVKAHAGKNSRQIQTPLPPPDRA